jgi:DNA polymerase III epsilon subunit-like protein
VRSPTGDIYGPWWRHNLVVFDVETTGLEPEEDRIIEMGFARFENGEFVGSYGTLIYPGMLIPEEATAIHGISSADVASAPSFPAALHRAADICRNAWPCAYNADFDKAFWFAELGRCGIEPPWPIADPVYEWLDPLVWVRNQNGWGGNKLVAVAERYAVALENAHRATDDAVSAGRILFEIRNLMPSVTLIELLRRQRYYNSGHREQIEAWKGRKRAAGTPV